MLSIEKLSVNYGAVRALDELALDAEKGMITAVLGANGAGKTTLLRSISGLVKASSGNIVFEGVRLNGMPAESIARHGVAHVPEGRGVI
ncbi:MAG: ATP-binding cassette domain-containing protein, partial [Acidimicrobiales bacterium]